MIGFDSNWLQNRAELFWRKLPGLLALVLALNPIAIPTARAGALAWEKEIVELDSEPAAKGAKFDLRFKNLSDRAVTITGIKPTCACTVAELEKLTYQPGESGSITATLNHGPLLGVLTKEVIVMTDEPDGKPTRLTLRANVRELVALEPCWMIWHVGEAPIEKTFLCTATTARYVALAEAALAEEDTGFAIRVEPVEAGRQYRVYVKPKTTEKRTNAVVRIRTVITDLGARDYDVYAGIR